MLVTIECEAQSFTVGDLWWPSGHTNITVTPEAPPVAYPVFMMLPQDSGSIDITNFGTCTTSTNLFIYPFLGGGFPFNGTAGFVGDFADFTLGFNWVFGVSSYQPNTSYTGYDQFTYIVTNNISPTHLFATALIQTLMYDTNGTHCYGLQSFNSNSFNIQLPNLAIDRSVDFYVYMNGSFTNHFQHTAGLFTPSPWFILPPSQPDTTVSCSPPFFQCYATIVVPSAGNLCTTITNNPPPAPTNYCGDPAIFPDNLTNVLWSLRSANIGSGFGVGVTGPTISTNGIIDCHFKNSGALSGATVYEGYRICGGITNRPVLVSGVLWVSNALFGSSATITVGQDGVFGTNITAGNVAGPHYYSFLFNGIPAQTFSSNFVSISVNQNLSVEFYSLTTNQLQ